LRILYNLNFEVKL